jgi:hypothetical protein
MKQLLIVYAMLPGCASAQQMIIVPRGQHVVLVDGKLGPGEWDDGASFLVADKARLYVNQSGGYVWLAVEYLAGTILRSMFT